MRDRPSSQLYQRNRFYLFWSSMADHQHSEEQIETWREAFDIFDKNKDGHISLRELDTVVRSMGLNPSMKDLRSFIKEVDQNRDGKIQFEDFKILMSKFYVNNSPEEQQKDIEGAFKIFDKNGNGVIEKAELLRIATTLGEPLTEEEAEQMMKIADANKDGLIDYKEFSKFITRPVLNSTMGQWFQKRRELPSFGVHAAAAETISFLQKDIFMMFIDIKHF